MNSRDLHVFVSSSLTHDMWKHLSAVRGRGKVLSFTCGASFRVLQAWRGVLCGLAWSARVE